MSYSSIQAKKVSINTLTIIAIVAALWSSHAGARNLIREPAREQSIGTDVTAQPALECAASATTGHPPYRKLPHVVPVMGTTDARHAECVAIAATDLEQKAPAANLEQTKRNSLVFRNDRNNAHAHL